MDEATFARLLEQARGTAEHMMLIGLGEPLLDGRIFDRIAFCHEHGISSLISTNGVLLDEAAAARLLESPLSHITLSFDGYSRETFEFYRKGARFDRVRDNFVRFCRMKHERHSKLQIVVQMVRMDGNRHEEQDFRRFWRAVPGVDVIRVKEDETDLLRPLPPPARRWRHACHYLWRGALYVKHNGDVYPCCQSYMLDGRPVGNLNRKPLTQIFNGEPMREMRRLHGAGRAGEIDICARCRTVIPHPLLVVGSLLLHGNWVRALLPLVERISYLFGNRLLNSQAAGIPGQPPGPSPQATLRVEDPPERPGSDGPPAT
jgi:radical SAM protein with 4Fe4S-binding SPASM domain